MTTNERKIIEKAKTVLEGVFQHKDPKQVGSDINYVIGQLDTLLEINIEE